MMYRFVSTLALLLICLALQTTANAAPASRHYDIAYVWGTELEAILDYKLEIETLLGPEVARKLKIVRRGRQYGIVYDRNGSALAAARVALAHGAILGRAGLRAATAIDQADYFELYNVCYGLGRNLNDLERQYAIIYRYLGKEVGKELFIEKTAANNYLLIYRRLGDKKSTLRVANRHAALLRKKGIPASITPEKNNEIVRGESSHLDRQEEQQPSNLARSRQPPTTSALVKLEPSARKIAPASPAQSPLEQKIENYIKGLRQQGKIYPDERTAWLVFDFTRETTLVNINAEQVLQAASMIKPFVALAFFLKVKEGKIIYGPRSRRKMEAMIQRSDNQATNWVMRQVGGPQAVQRTLKQHYGELIKSTEIVEYIPANGRTYRNRAAPVDYGTFLRSLWAQKLTSGQELRRLMALPGRDRLYNGTPIPQGTLVYNKTGTTAHLCGDMGILSPKGKDGRRYPYSMVAVIEKQKRPRNYSRWKLRRSNIIRQVSTMVYHDLKARHNLL